MNNEDGSMPLPTLEDLLKEKWTRFQPLGTDVEKVTELLLTLWTRKDSNEVLEALDGLVKILVSIHEEIGKSNVMESETDKAAQDPEDLLVQLLVNIIRFCCPILKSDALHKGKLFKALTKLAHDFEVEHEDPEEFPSALRELQTTTDFIDELINNANGDLDMLQCTAMTVVRIDISTFTENKLMCNILKPLPTINDDATRACIIYAAAHLSQVSSFINNKAKAYLVEVCETYLFLSDVSLTKLMAAVVHARAHADKVSDEVLAILADYMLHFEEYEKIFDTTLLPYYINLSEVIRKHNTDWWILLLTFLFVAESVSRLSAVSDKFYDRLLVNLKSLIATDDLDPRVFEEAVVSVCNYAMHEPILPGMKVIDMQPLSVALLQVFVGMDKVWTNGNIREFFESRGIPTTKEDLAKFLSEAKDDGSTKRFPTFAGIDQIPWDKLHHAYGKATDVPECLRNLASVNQAVRDRAQHALYGNIYHQGSRYSATPYAVPYLMEMLECSLVQDKYHILRYCVDLLTSYPGMIFFDKTGYDVDVEYPNYHSEDDEDGDPVHINHQIERHIVNGLPAILKLLTDSDPSTRGYSAYLMAYLPRVALQTVPKIKEQIQVETDPSTKGSLLLSLSFILPRVTNHEESLQYFKSQWDLVKDSDDETLKFCIAMSIGRLLIDQTPPKYVVDQVLKVLADPASDIVIYFDAFDNVWSMAHRFIMQAKPEAALPSIINCFKNASQAKVYPLMRAMLAIAFRSEMKKAFFTSEISIKPAALKLDQIEVLQAIVDRKDLNHESSSILESFQLPLLYQLRTFIEKAKANHDVMDM